MPPKYYALRVYIDERDIELWNDFVRVDKDELTHRLCGILRAEMPTLKKAALRAASLQACKPRGTLRRILLLRLPEYEDVFRFLQAHARRAVFRQCLKALVLYGETGLVDAEPGHTVNSLPACPEHAKNSPAALFKEAPSELFRVMLTELRGEPGAIRLDALSYDWLAVPPEEYPPEIQHMPPFSVLRSFWAFHHPKGGA